ncbi:MAG: hypothetical protein P1Q69_06135 [Candidatus Thorarchaeota archaeon]|nr:hypothetical protein [Candidatus Thorarchaeota archaeon]
MTKKHEIRGSKEAKRLYDSIERDPNHRVFGTPNLPRSKVKAIGALIIAVAFTITFPVTLYFLIINPHLLGPLFPIIVIVTVILVLCPILGIHAGYNYDRIILNDVGVGEEIEYVSLNGRPAGLFEYYAIAWKDVEAIEVKQKGDKVAHIKIRGIGRTVTTNMGRWNNNLTLEIVQEYLPKFLTWPTRLRVGEKHAVVYYKPERKDARKMYEIQPEEYESEEEIIEAIGMQDFETYYKTAERPNSLTPEALFEKIDNEPMAERLIDKPRLRWMAQHQGLSCIIFIIIFTGILYFAFSGFLGREISSMLGFMLMGLGTLYFTLFMLSICWGGKKLILNEIGIGKYSAIITQAIEWEHVDFIDITFDEGMIVGIQFFGNQRTLFFNQKKSAILFTLDMLQEHIPDFQEWMKSNKEEWGEETTRYTRPEL